MKEVKKMREFNLKSEKICDFLVDEQRKRIWKIELDMLEKIIQICNKYNLRYTLSGGSMLGVVRHHGFIPWDDDIDIDMLREDYERFLVIAEKELEKPYFVQYYKTEKGYYYGHAQIRNSNTTAIIKNDSYNKTFNHGIFIDIFPLDNVPDDIQEKNKIIRKIEKAKNKINKKIYDKSNNIIKNIIKQIRQKVIYKKVDIQNEIKFIDEEAQKYNNKKTEEVCALTFNPRDFCKERKWLEELVDKKFEYLDVKISKYYNEWLTRQYGDYMKIPDNKNGSTHGKVFFDTENSYIKYDKQIEKITKNL